MLRRVSVISEIKKGVKGFDEKNIRRRKCRSKEAKRSVVLVCLGLVMRDDDEWARNRSIFFGRREKIMKGRRRVSCVPMLIV